MAEAVIGGALLRVLENVIGLADRLEMGFLVRASAMIGSGIFLLPANLAPYGLNAIWGWVITIGGAMCLATVFAGLAKAMRVAMLSSISWRTPPRAYGPWELVTSLLTEALVERGVDVTLFATLDSITGGKLDGVAARGYSEDDSLNAKVWEALHIAHLFERASNFDLIHNQADYLPLVFSRMVDTPIVTTIHGFSSPSILPVFQRYNGRSAYVAISDADRHPSLNYAATIHHGIPIDDFPFDPVGSEEKVINRDAVTGFFKA